MTSDAQGNGDTMSEPKPAIVIKTDHWGWWACPNCGATNFLTERPDKGDTHGCRLCHYDITVAGWSE